MLDSIKVLEIVTSEFSSQILLLIGHADILSDGNFRKLQVSKKYNLHNNHSLGILVTLHLCITQIKFNLVGGYLF